MNQVKSKFSNPKQPRMRPFKYEMTKRKEKWKALYEPIERTLSVPPESQASIVQELVSERVYNFLVPILNLPEWDRSHEPEEGPRTPSAETIIPYIPPDPTSSQTDARDSLVKKSGGSIVRVQSTLSEDSSPSQHESLERTLLLRTESLSKTNKSEAGSVDSYHSDTSSDFVEVEKKRLYDRQMMLRHKAILRFLSLPEEEAATWRVKDAKDVSDLSQMTLEEKGDFLIKKIAVDFCNWIKELGGDEKSFISEEIVKELFQIGMDNPATRAICMKTREKRVLYHNLASFLNMQDKSFHEVLLKHLNWDAEIEKMPSKITAFGKSLPKNLRFKTPKNKTAETWLEWNKLSEEQLSFADVYKDIKDLRSTKEYCRWMKDHPEHKRPQYLVDLKMFEDPKLLEPRPGSARYTIYNLS